MSGMVSLSAVRACVAATADLVLPGACAVCHQTGAPLCAACVEEVAGALFAGGPRRVAPDPCPTGMPPTFAAGAYGGALGHLVAAYKDEDRRDCRRLLGGLAARSVDATVAGDWLVNAQLRQGRPVLLVPVPASAASRRRRGDAPLLGLAREAVRGFVTGEVCLADALRLTRRVRDQAGLDARSRAVNLEHAMTVRPSREVLLAGRACILVDDVLTTGATLVEARRALRSAGAGHVCAATICATERQRVGSAGDRHGRCATTAGA